MVFNGQIGTRARFHPTSHCFREVLPALIAEQGLEVPSHPVLGIVGCSPPACIELDGVVVVGGHSRSEERRAGQVCGGPGRSRWSPEDKKHKNTTICLVT